jgi:hypothetical protein
MRILLIFLTSALIISKSLISSADNSGAVLLSRIQTQEVKTAARKAWPAFFADFRQAVDSQDRKTLRKLMAKTFNAPPDTPEDAFRQWDDPKFGGWRRLKQVLAKGAVLSDESENDSPPENIRPTMISPPAADKGRYRGWFAAFEFQADGKWYCIQFTSMRDFSP